MARRVNNRKADLAMIHIAKKDLGMDDETYRALLQRVTGRDSSANLSIGQRGMVLHEFKRLGWSAQRKRSDVKYAEKGARLMIVQWNKLHKAGKVGCGTNECFERWIANQIRPEGADLPITKNPDTLDDAEMSDLISILKQWVAR